MTATTPPLPRVYCASKLRHSFMWRNWRSGLSCISIVSTWHDDPDVEAKEADPHACMMGWRTNRLQILHMTDHLLVYGNKYDALNGTLTEVGMAMAMAIPIHLVGTYPWASWRHFDGVTVHDSLDAALTSIVSYTPIEPENSP